MTIPVSSGMELGIAGRLLSKVCKANVARAPRGRGAPRRGRATPVGTGSEIVRPVKEEPISPLMSDLLKARAQGSDGTRSERFKW